MNETQAVIAATHDGVFHSDEILAIALLRLAAQPNHVSVIRSRLPKDWERADYVIDVGGKSDGVKWFDHHMPQGAGERANGVPYSAFGLMWQAVGTTAVRNILGASIEQHVITDLEVAEVVEDLAPFVAGVDAHDQAMLSTSSKFVKDRKVMLEVLTLQQVISNSNPIPLLEDFNDSNSNKQFYDVLEWATAYLSRFIKRKASRVLSQSFVAKYDNGEKVIVLPRYCDWNSPVAARSHILFVVYPSVNGKSYTVQATKKGGGAGSTDNLRMPFPLAWAGLNEGALQKVSGIADAAFCHRDRFIAAAMTLQGAIAMAKTTIKQAETQ
jgi:uncharacterized UPF0160 family protein